MRNIVSRSLFGALVLLVLSLPIIGYFDRSAHAQGLSNTNSTYPAGAIAVIGSSSGANTTSALATLTGTPGRTTYICGFAVSGLGLTTGAAVNIGVATVAGGLTMNYQYVYPTGATVATTPVSFTFSPCVPASIVGNSIFVTVPGGAGNTSTNISAWGYLFGG